jgi:hypothetical protein
MPNPATAGGRRKNVRPLSSPFGKEFRKAFPMSEHDFNRPFLDLDSMDLFTAVRTSDARRYGKTVRAFVLSNREYQHRFNRLGKKNNMKPPPGSHNHIMPGYLVVRKLGTADQNETWMPDQVFEEVYEKQRDLRIEGKE